jgi:hypothetical protein
MARITKNSITPMMACRRRRTDGPASADGLARAHEQARADRAADGDQLDVPVRQLTGKVPFVRGCI